MGQRKILVAVEALVVVMAQMEQPLAVLAVAPGMPVQLERMAHFLQVLAAGVVAQVVVAEVITTQAAKHLQHLVEVVEVAEEYSPDQAALAVVGVEVTVQMVQTEEAGMPQVEQVEPLLAEAVDGERVAALPAATPQVRVEKQLR